jgi:Xaa-Pro dipeptidase
MHCGHLIGNFPHEKIHGEDEINYIHPNNKELMSEKDINGNERFWIYEIHFIDQKRKIGGFFEQLLYLSD